MTSLMRACGALLVAAITSVGSVGISEADTEDGQASPSCTFALSPPQRSQLGTDPDVATATLRPVSCTGSVQPSRSTVCIGTGRAQGSCSTAYAWNTAQVFSSVVSDGATTTGTGCWSAFRPEDFGCTTFGPISASG
jgi:hypothetical protein